MSIEIRDQVTGDWLPAPKGFDVEEAIEDAQESNGAVDAVRENGVIVWAAS